MSRFKEYNPEQQLPLAPDLSDWLADGRLAYSVRDVVGELYLYEICAGYDSSGDGQCGMRIDTRRKAEEVSVVDLGQTQQRQPRVVEVDTMGPHRLTRRGEDRLGLRG